MVLFIRITGRRRAAGKITFVNSAYNWPARPHDRLRLGNPVS
jgi:hypothetical protein